MARLGDIASVITKGTTPTSVGFEFVDTGINFIRIESISETGEFLNEKFAYISELCHEKLKRSQLCEKDILFSIAGAIGRTAIVTKEILPANVNQALAIIRIPEETINYSYLIFALQSPALLEQFEKQKQGVAQVNLSLKNVGDFIIPDYSLKEQSKIATLLEKVSNLIALRKQQLQKLDDLVKARFVEMFGNIAENPYDFTVVTMKEIAEELFAGGDKPSDLSNVQTEDYQYPVYANGENKQGLQGYAKSYRVAKRAITVAARGTIGYCCVRDAFFTPVVRLITLVPNDTVDLLYLQEAIRMTEIKSSGTSQGQLTVPDFEKLHILLPPIERQEIYTKFILKVQKETLTVQNGLDKLELLKKALMQHYFG